MKHFQLIFPLSVAAVLVVAGVAARSPEGEAGPVNSPAIRSGGDLAGPIDFNKAIRPILNKHCTACHGGVKKAGGISFLFREEAMVVGESGKPAITPGKPELSHLMDRITNTKDPMPPVEHGPMLPAHEVALFKRWIEEGAKWADHWAFVPPVKPPVPTLATGSEWGSGPVDAFILEKLIAEGLTPAEEADRPEWLRRVSLDLTGLPPTPEEIDAFLADQEAGAHERVVNRLLASPAYGERWASVWMDLARYSDTKGYEKDPHRDIWPWRDWLIRSLNANIPYHQFITEMMAGDLLPGATLDQQLATAFHRNTQSNAEGGTDDEEFRVLATLDRISTTWAALCGVSFNCVQCHTHPYDPIRHEEFYRFLAFFNNTLDADLNDDFPTLRVPDNPADASKAAALTAEIGGLRREVLTGGPSLDLFAPDGWIPLVPGKAGSNPEANLRIDGRRVSAPGTVSQKAVYDIEFPVSATRLSALRLWVPVENREKAAHTPESGFILGRLQAMVRQPDGQETEIPFSRVLTDTADEPRDPRGVLRADKEGFAAEPDQHHDRVLVLIPNVPVELPPGSRLRVLLHHGDQISEKPAPIRHLEMAISSEEKWPGMAGDADYLAKSARLDAALAELRKIPGTNVPVLRERSPGNQRETRVFVRGNWLEKDKKAVVPGVPKVFPPLPADRPADRLALAGWLVAPNHPLTARVAVNRFWEQLFGTGLVETLEDFGSVGQTPSHPALLDWLAVHFQKDLAWDNKAMLRELVLSATYRQSHKIPATLREKDPRNRLLARGPRTRLNAEMVRDQALAASGLLSRKMGGAPVMPMQPEGVWRAVYSGAKWKTSGGEDAHRRAIYTYWRRTSPYPSFLTFDAPNRDLCTVRRLPTNTPLQALVKLNDPVYQEAAVALANRAWTDAGQDARRAVALAHRRVVGREPASPDLDELLLLYTDSQAVYQADANLLKESGAGSAETAALANTISVILNLDAALVK